MRTTRCRVPERSSTYAKRHAVLLEQKSTEKARRTNNDRPADLAVSSRVLPGPRGSRSHTRGSDARTRPSIGRRRLGCTRTATFTPATVTAPRASSRRRLRIRIPRRRRLGIRPVIQIPLAAIAQRVVTRQGVARGALAVVEVAVDEVEAEGRVLHREAHLRGRALHRGRVARDDVCHVGQPRVGRVPLLDRVADYGERVVREEDVEAAAATAAGFADVLFEGCGVAGGAGGGALGWGRAVRNMTTEPMSYERGLTVT